MRYGKRHFYAIGCREKDRKQHDRSHLYRRRYGPYGLGWNNWQVEAYLAGYYGLDPSI